MSGAPRATVVITTHDRPELVGHAVASALAQTEPDVQVVVVDDGSEPPLALDVEDRRVEVLRNDPARGMCGARNVGLAAARAPWVVFLDDDDELAPDMVERSLAAVAASTLPAPVAAMGAMVVIDAAGREQARVPPLTLPRGADCFLEGPSFRAKNALLLPAEVVRAIGGWDEDLRDWEADDFGLRLNAAASIQGLASPLYRMRAHAGPRMSQRWAAMADDMERTREKHADAFARHRRADSEFLGTLGFYHLEAGHWGRAIAWTARGVARDPRRRHGWLLGAAALAGPGALRLSRTVRRPDAGIPFPELMASRGRKWGRRAVDALRAVVGVPAAAAVGRATRRLRGRPLGGPVLLVGVYRAANAPVMAALVDPVVAAGGTVRLWALDRTAPALADLTVATGPGPKFRLLDALVDDVDVAAFEWVVAVDDDVCIDRGTVLDLLAVADAARLDLVQPAHTERSHRTNDLVLRRPGAVARRTTFVEIGPVFAVRRPWVAEVLPFPPEHAMGWGLELDWWAMEQRGARLGVVDAVAARHLVAPGRAYGRDAEQARLDAALAAAGVGSLAEIQRTVATWWIGRPSPPWSADDPR